MQYVSIQAYPITIHAIPHNTPPITISKIHYTFPNTKPEKSNILCGIPLMHVSFDVSNSSTITIPSISSNHGNGQHGQSSSSGSHHSHNHNHHHSNSHNTSSHTSFKLPASTAHSTAGGPSSNCTSTKAKCIRTVLAGPSMSRGIRSSVFSKCACNHLRCLSCNFKVHVFLGNEWTSQVDYMFFRNNVPNETNLAVQVSQSLNRSFDGTVIVSVVLSYLICTTTLS